MTSKEYPHMVRISWKNGDTVSDWDHKCIWAIENFGLPGNKYITDLNEQYMDFLFKDSQDAVHFSLVCQ